MPEKMKKWSNDYSNLHNYSQIQTNTDKHQQTKHELLEHEKDDEGQP
jgi:hypothetical protein